MPPKPSSGYCRTGPSGSAVPARPDWIAIRPPQAPDRRPSPGVEWARSNSTPPGGSTGTPVGGGSIPMERGSGERRLPVALPLGEGSFHHPASGLGQAGAHGNPRQFDPFPQLAAEAEGGTGAKHRQGAWGGCGGVKRGLCVGEDLTIIHSLVERGI